jgi:hypothetical protein
MNLERQKDESKKILRLLPPGETYGCYLKSIEKKDRLKFLI